MDEARQLQFCLFCAHAQLRGSNRGALSSTMRRIVVEILKVGWSSVDPEHVWRLHRIGRSLLQLWRAVLLFGGRRLALLESVLHTSRFYG